MLLILTLHESTYTRSIKKYDSHTNSTVLSMKLCMRFLSSFFLKAATTRTGNVDEWFGSLESFISIFSYISYFECYEFDINVKLILIATCLRYLSSWIQIRSTHLYSNSHEYSWVAIKRIIADLWFILHSVSGDIPYPTALTVKIL